MSHLLDSSTAIDILRGRKSEVRSRFAEAFRRRTALFVSSVVVFELRYGVERSTNRDKSAATLDDFLSVPLRALPFDHDDADEAARLRAALEKAGTPIGPYDLMIAAQASRRAWTVVTGNVAEFRRVPGLAVEDWSA